MHIPMETNHETKTKRTTFSLSSRSDDGELMFFNAGVKLLYQQI